MTTKSELQKFKLRFEQDDEDMQHVRQALANHRKRCRDRKLAKAQNQVDKLADDDTGRKIEAL